MLEVEQYGPDLIPPLPQGYENITTDDEGRIMVTTRPKTRNKNKKPVTNVTNVTAPPKLPPQVNLEDILRPPERNDPPTFLGEMFNKPRFGIPVGQFIDYDYQNARLLYVKLVDPDTKIPKPLDPELEEVFFCYIEEEIGEFAQTSGLSLEVYVFLTKEARDNPGRATQYALKLRNKVWRGWLLLPGVVIDEM